MSLIIIIIIPLKKKKIFFRVGSFITPRGGGEMRWGRMKKFYELTGLIIFLIGCLCDIGSYGVVLSICILITTVFILAEI